MQIMLKRGFAADRFRLAMSYYRPLVAAVRSLVHPCAIRLAELRDERCWNCTCKFTDCANTHLLQPCARLGPYAVYLAYSERPDARFNVILSQHRESSGLLEVGSDFGQQLVRRNANRA